MILWHQAAEEAWGVRWRRHNSPGPRESQMNRPRWPDPVEGGTMREGDRLIGELQPLRKKLPKQLV